MATRCSWPNCDRDVRYSWATECVLHQKKDVHRRKLLEAFRNALLDEVFRQLKQSYGAQDDQEISECLADPDRELPDEIISRLRKQPFLLQEIRFPYCLESDKFSFMSILGSLQFIQFVSCEISFPQLHPNWGITGSFHDCKFLSLWYGNTTNQPDGSSFGIYSSCNFEKGLHLDRCVFDSQDDLNSAVFHNCRFSSHLHIRDCVFNIALFPLSDPLFSETNIDNAHISGCLFKRPLDLYKARIGICEIEDCKFLSGVDLSNAQLSNLHLSNCVVEADFEVDRADLGIATFKNVAFKGFVKIERSRFGGSALRNKPRTRIQELTTPPVEFVNVSFTRPSSFRYSTFEMGLDLSGAAFMAEANFFGSEVGFENSPRETFRFLKHTFDKVGNHYEANKYFACECEKLLSEKSLWRDPQQYVILMLNFLVSKFGQSIFLPILWCFILSISFSLIILLHEAGYPYGINSGFDDIFNSISIACNFVAKGVIPFRGLLIDGMEFVTLIYSIGFAIVIWQLAVAIKRLSRRY